MTFVVYALRVKGDPEVRYVGQCADKDQRLAGHFSTATNMPWATNFANWFRENGDQIEAVELATATTRDEARRIERATVAMFLALDHRLFNQWLVPAHRRVPPRGEAVWPGSKAA